MEPFLIVIYVVIGVFLGVFATGFGVHLCLQNGQIRGKCCCPRRHEPLERVTFRNTSFLSNSSEESVYTVCQALYPFQIQLQHTHLLTNFLYSSCCSLRNLLFCIPPPLRNSYLDTLYIFPLLFSEGLQWFYTVLSC